MKNNILLMCFILFAACLGMAQQPSDKELMQLINTVASLRNADETTWNAALETFNNDKAWTMMDEISRDDNEYWLIGSNYFKLNAILSRISGYSEKMVAGDFLNGNDPNFNYSLIERGIKKGGTVSYEMKYRHGRQTFVVMPYDTNKAKQIEFEAFVNGNSAGKAQRLDDDNLYLNIDQDINDNDTIRLVVTNHSDSDMPVVIINHNTRKY